MCIESMLLLAFYELVLLSFETQTSNKHEQAYDGRSNDGNSHDKFGDIFT